MVLRYFYSIEEVLPEAIDLTDCPNEELKGNSYLLRTCKTCRGEFLSMLQEWRNKRLATRETPKDHDGYPLNNDQAAIPVRRHGRVVWMTWTQYAEWMTNSGEPLDIPTHANLD